MEHTMEAAATKAAAKQRIYLRPPVAYYGGKQTLLADILPLIPPHKKYVEPFLGGGAVFWAKEPSPVEVINDMDGFVTNFYRQFKSNFAELKAMIDATVYGRESHDEAATIRQRQGYFSEVQRAWAFFVLANLCRDASLKNQCLSPGDDSKRSRTFYGKVAMLNAAYSERFRNVFVEQREALYVIKKNDAPDTFFFVDPPYFQADMGHYAGYTREDFGELLAILAGLRGRFVLTSYPSDLLDEWAGRQGWHLFKKEMHLPSAGKSKRKTEVITTNYERTQTDTRRAEGAERDIAAEPGKG